MFSSYIQEALKLSSHVQLHDDSARELCIEHTIIYMMTGKSKIKSVKVMGLCLFFLAGSPWSNPTVSGSCRTL